MADDDIEPEEVSFEETFRRVAAIPGIVNKLEMYHGNESGAWLDFEEVEIEPGVFIVKLYKIYSLQSVADLLDVKLSTVRNWVNKGHLVATRTRAGVRVMHKDLQVSLKRLYSPPTATGMKKALAARGITMKEDR